MLLPSLLLKRYIIYIIIHNVFKSLFLIMIFIINQIKICTPKKSQPETIYESTLSVDTEKTAKKVHKTLKYSFFMIYASKLYNSISFFFFFQSLNFQKINPPPPQPPMYLPDQLIVLNPNQTFYNSNSQEKDFLFS